MKLIRGLTFVLLVIGGLDWGFFALFRHDAMTALFGVDHAILLSRLLYGLIGLSALYQLFIQEGVHKRWDRLIHAHART
jgi:uncharacterized membrane protein YuzA (DUF378 family)